MGARATPGSSLVADILPSGFLLQHMGAGGNAIAQAASQAIAATQQVWSSTQFYSVDFSQSRIGVKSAFSTNAQSRFVSVVVDCVLGPPRLARHT